MATLFSANPIKLVFEASMKGMDFIFFDVLFSRCTNDSQMVEAVKTAKNQGIEIRNMPRWAQKQVDDSQLYDSWSCE